MRPSRDWVQRDDSAGCKTEYRVEVRIRGRFAPTKLSTFYRAGRFIQRILRALCSSTSLMSAMPTSCEWVCAAKSFCEWRRRPACQSQIANLGATGLGADKMREVTEYRHYAD